MIKGILRAHGQIIEIKKRVKSGGGYTGAKETLEPFASCKGVLKYLSGEEQIKYDKLQTIATHKLYLDYRDDLESSMVVVIANKEYEISYIDNPMKFNRFLTLYLKESG